MAKTGDPNPEDVVKAFRKAASELGCQSEQRFQEVLFAIGTRKTIPQRIISSRSLPARHRRPPSRLILEIDIGERLPVVVAHDEAGGLFLDCPRWWKTAFCHSAFVRLLIEYPKEVAVLPGKGGLCRVDCRLHRHQLFDRMHVCGGSHGFALAPGGRG
jgi:hypothetical protein